jgi:uncharacterized protein YjdB
MKTRDLLMLAVLAILATVGFTGCDELAVEDNPMQSYLTMRTSDVTLKVGDTYLRKAVAAGTAVVVYSSSDATVATVDQEGKVTAINPGTATITAQTTGYNAEGKKIYLAEEKSYKVTVKPATATSLSLDKTMKVLVKDGAALTLTATVTPSYATFTWTSSDEAIATVNNGVVTPVGLGIATIIAKSGDLTATCEVFVGTEVDDVSARNPIQDYDILAGTKNTSAITIPAGCHVALNGVNTNKGVKCNGEATIYLIDGSTNTITALGYAGIEVGAAGLTINAETAGTGILNVTSVLFGAGIGTSDATDSSQTCGDITINGGTITARGGLGAAGIGTSDSWGDGAPANQTCGDITINGGIVTAIGGQYGAGIGTGLSYSTGPVTSNKCGTITIGTGVTSVTATNGTYSDSIGMGTIGGGSPGIFGIQNCGTITFGTVQVFDGTAANGTWTPSPMAAGTYGGLNLAISTTTNADDTWTLTPVTP